MNVSRLSPFLLVLYALGTYAIDLWAVSPELLVLAVSAIIQSFRRHFRA